MRRSQAGQVDPSAPLDARSCRVCGGSGVSIIALGSNDNGAIELAYCSPRCAMTQGWPWLRSERDRSEPDGQGALFAPGADP